MKKSLYKSNAILITIMTIACMLTSSCTLKFEKDEEDNTPKVTKTLDLKDYNAIDANGNVEISFVQDSTYKVVATATERTFEKNAIYVKDSTLIIGKAEEEKNVKIIANLAKRRVIKLEVHAPSLKDIDFSGEALFNTDSINADKLRFDFSGASEMNAKCLDTKNLAIKSSGASKININVKEALETKLDFSGAANINADFDNCGSVDIDASGAVDGKITGTVKQYNKKVAGAANINTDKLSIE